MNVELPKYVRSWTDDHGNTQVWFRRRGRQKKMLGEPGSAAFYKQYAELLEQPTVFQAGADGIMPGSFGQLAAKYFTSQDFFKLSDNSKYARRRLIGKLLERFKDAPVNKLEWRHIKKFRDEYGNKLAAANDMMKCINVLLNFAIPEFIKYNPVPRGKLLIKYTTKGHATWTESHIEQFRAFWALGTRERLALELYLNTASRGSDAGLIGFKNVAEGLITFTAAKNHETVTVPMDPELIEALAAMPDEQAAFVVSNRGTPYSEGTFGRWFSVAARKAGLPKGYTGHGLRKARSVQLAESGASDAELMASLGDKSSSMVRLYTKDAEVKGLSIQAAQRLSAKRTAAKGGN